MTVCDCQCCIADPPVRCARELVLSSRDQSAAARVAAFVGQSDGARVNLTTSAVREDGSGPAEPTAAVQCRSCAQPFVLPAFLAGFVAKYGVPLNCTRCQ